MTSGKPVSIPGAADLSKFGTLVDDTNAPSVILASGAASPPAVLPASSQPAPTNASSEVTTVDGVRPDGSRYRGQMLDGRRHGEGEWSSGSAEYVGQWENDTMHGNGRHTWTDGRSYEGQFVRGQFSGKGRMEWGTKKGPLVYDGQYKDDMKHGNGCFKWPDGRAYNGEWSSGKRHGKGAYTDTRGDTKIGYWNGN